MSMAWPPNRGERGACCGILHGDRANGISNVHHGTRTSEQHLAEQSGEKVSFLFCLYFDHSQLPLRPNLDFLIKT